MEACCLGSTRFRILSLVFLCFVPVFSIMILSFVKGPELFASLGISDAQDGLMLSFFAILPITLFIVVMWQRLVLKVPFPPLRRTLLRPNILQRWLMKLIVILYLLRCLLMYFSYGNSLQSVISVGLSILSLYASVVVCEIGFHMAKDERVLHPFRKRA